jgi:recombinational DNA repair protein (RecF pathway)
MPICDKCERFVNLVTLHPFSGENECPECRERREEREAEAAWEQQSTWRDAPAKFAANH